MAKLNRGATWRFGRAILRVTVVTLIALPCTRAIAADAVRGNPETAAKSVSDLMTGFWVAPFPRPAPNAPPTTPANSIFRFPPDLINRLHPWAAEVLAGYRKAAESSKEPGTPDNHCLPFAMAGERVAYLFAFKLIVQPKVVVFLFNLDHMMRIVYMDEKQHPKDLVPSWYGHSIGRWEGDTLVIETIGYNDRSAFADGVAHSPKLKTIERYRMADGKSLEAVFSFEDPDAFTGTYTYSSKYGQGEIWQESVCAENNKEWQAPLEPGGSPFKGYRLEKY